MLRSRKAITGQSLTEFALILPLLALLMVGTIDLARVFYIKVTLANASRAAAEVAINYDLARQLGGTTAANTRVRDRAVAEAGPGVPITTANVTLTHFDTSSGTWQSGMTWQSGDKYRVRVTATFYPITPMVGALLTADPLTITDTAEMRHSCIATTATCDY